MAPNATKRARPPTRAVRAELVIPQVAGVPRECAHSAGACTRVRYTHTRRTHTRENVIRWRCTKIAHVRAHKGTRARTHASAYAHTSAHETTHIQYTHSRTHTQSDAHAHDHCTRTHKRAHKRTHTPNDPSRTQCPLESPVRAPPVPRRHRVCTASAPRLHRVGTTRVLCRVPVERLSTVAWDQKGSRSTLPGSP